MRVYLAAAWSRREEIRGYAKLLADQGVNVQARWLDQEPDFPADGVIRSKYLQSRAELDVDDVRECDVLVRFSDDLSPATVPSRLASGARMFEMGLAWSLGKKIIVVGGTQCVFDYLRDIIHLDNVEALRLYLGSYL